MRSITLRLYRALLNAFPHEFRSVYGDSLLRAAEDAAEPTWRSHGPGGLLRLLADAALRIPAEYLTEFRRDVRHGLRMLARSPGFTAVALVSLSLGISVATCAYSEMNGVLRELPGVTEPAQLVALGTPVSFPAYRRYRELKDLFSSSFAYVAPVPFGVALDGHTVRSWGHLVTSSYFSTLGARPLLGRFLDAGDERPGLAPAVVVSQRFWAERLGAQAAAVGSVLRVNGQPCTIVGVAREDFLGASPVLFAADLWLSVSAGAGVAPELEGGALERHDLTMFQVVGRLRPGVSEAAAEAELSAAAEQLARSYGD